MHEVSGELYSNLLQKRVFAPLGISHTRNR